jgi:ATP synthase protein I
LEEKPKTGSGLGGAAEQMRRNQPYLDAVWEFLGGILGGWLGGYFLDRWLHTSPWGLLALGTLGTVGGLVACMRRLSQLEKKK